MREKIDKSDFIKFINCYVKETFKRIKKQATNWKKTFAKHMSNKGLVSIIYKDLLKSKSSKTD